MAERVFKVFKESKNRVFIEMTIKRSYFFGLINPTSVVTVNSWVNDGFGSAFVYCKFKTKKKAKKWLKNNKRHIRNNGFVSQDYYLTNKRK